MANRAEQQQARRARARLEPYDENAPWHGTTNGYTNHVCRCDPCRQAYKVYNDEWRKRPEVAERRRMNGRAATRRYRDRPHNVLRSKARQYGLDEETLGTYLADGICFACGSEGVRLAVDHDHACCADRRRSCGTCVRGLLCHPCNKVLGMVNDDRDRLRLLIAYLNRWEDRCASKSA